MTYEDIIENLRQNINFSLSRFGDGEINAILGATQGQRENCDGHQYFKDMGIRLYKVIEEYKNREDKGGYIMGLQGLAQRTRADDVDFQELISGIDWIDSDMIHKHSIRTNGNFNELYEALDNRHVILVANDLLIPIAMKTADMHIIIGRTDCWLEYSDVLKRLREIIETDSVILYCASMMTEVLIDDIWNDYGDTVTQIDIGSAFDPFVGEMTRTYHKKLKL